MRLVLHPRVHSDIGTIMDYYERSAGPELADEFYAELRYFMVQARERPETFAIRDRDIRRVNLRRFPYHFLFRIAGDVVRNLVVRHHSRHPSGVEAKMKCRAGSGVAFHETRRRTYQNVTLVIFDPFSTPFHFGILSILLIVSQ